MIRNGLLDWCVMRSAASRDPRQPPPSVPDDPTGLSRAAVDAARARGFAAAGVLAASRPVSFERFRAWLEQGFHGEMAYLERDAAACAGGKYRARDCDYSRCSRKLRGRNENGE